MIVLYLLNGGARRSYWLLHMAPFHSPNHLRNSCPLMAAILILPALALAGQENGKGNDGQNNGKGNDRNIPIVPEANAGWVLIPFVGGVLLFSWRQFSHAKA